MQCPPKKQEMRAGRNVSSLLRGSRINDKHNFHITLKQWKILHSVVHHGTFADAAEQLHMSQSAISYTIAKLQEQLGIALFVLEGRKAKLTPSGRELLERSRHLIRDAAELELFAEGLRQGWEAEVRLALEQDFPYSLLVSTLSQFSQSGKHLKVSLIETDIKEIKKSLSERTIDFGITTTVPTGFHSLPLHEVEYIAVASPNSPLFKLKREIVRSDLERQVHIAVVRSTEELSKEDPAPCTTGHRWNVNSVDAALSILREGIGYAWLPHHKVEKSLSQRELAILPFGHCKSYRLSFHLIYARPLTPGSMLNAFAELLLNKTENPRKLHMVSPSIPSQFNR